MKNNPKLFKDIKTKSADKYRKNVLNCYRHMGEDAWYGEIGERELIGLRVVHNKDLDDYYIEDLLTRNKRIEPSECEYYVEAWRGDNDYMIAPIEEIHTYDSYDLAYEDQVKDLDYFSPMDEIHNV